MSEDEDAWEIGGEGEEEDYPGAFGARVGWGGGVAEREHVGREMGGMSVIGRENEALYSVAPIDRRSQVRFRFLGGDLWCWNSATICVGV